MIYLNTNFSEPKVVLTGEREHATALYLACRHLPSELHATDGERAGMLTEAAAMLERIGDKQGMDSCYKLMRSLKGIASARG